MNIQRNSIVDLGTGNKIMTNGDNAHGIWSFGDIKSRCPDNLSPAEAMPTRWKFAAEPPISVPAAICILNWAVVWSTAPGTTINFTGTADNRNTIFSGGSYGASAQFSGAKINPANTDITIDRNGSLGLGLWALGGGVMTGDNISVTGAAGTVVSMP